jgi:hypothetical protein
MNRGSEQLTIDAGISSDSGTKGAFVRHFVEMLLVMFLGMGLMEGAAHLVFAATGGSLSDQPASFRVALMGVSMTAPMVVWMTYRGHPRARNAEMAASMLVPTVAAAALAGAGALQVGAALGLQHAVMIPAMLGVMLWRYDHYSQPHAPGPWPRRPSPVTKVREDGFLRADEREQQAGSR